MDSFFDFVNEAAAVGAEEAAPIFEALTQQTDRYKNDTGATRASTVAYVAGREDDRAEQARAAGEALNPGKSVEEQAEPEDPSAAATIITTAFMYYDDPLEAHTEFIAHATATANGQVADQIFATIAEAFE